MDPTPPADADDSSGRRKSASWMHTLGRLTFLLLTVFGLLQLFALLVQRSLVFPIAHIPVPAEAPDPALLGVEALWLDTDAGRVECWFAAAPNADAEHPAPAVLFAHGNGELIDDQRHLLEGYHALGVSVMLCEYPGYGRSGGKPSQKTLVAAFDAARELLMQRPDVDGRRIVYHGRSLGAGVVCALSRSHPPAAMILRSPFRSLAAIMAGYGILRPFVLDPFDNERALRDYEGPVLILHGRRDRVIPFEHGERLAEIAGAELSVWEHGHNDLPEDGDRHWSEIRTFLTQSRVLPDVN